MEGCVAIELLFRAFSTNSLIQDLVVFLRIRMFSVASMSISIIALSAMSSGNVGKPLGAVSLYFLANMDTYLSTKNFLSLTLSLEKWLIKLKRERSSAGKVSLIFPRGQFVVNTMMNPRRSCSRTRTQ